MEKVQDKMAATTLTLQYNGTFLAPNTSHLEHLLPCQIRSKSVKRIWRCGLDES